MINRFLPLLICFLLFPILGCATVKASYIHINGYKVFVTKFSQTSSAKKANVVFESGRGDIGKVWDKVAIGILPFANSLTYDRVNLGKSQHFKNNLRPVTAKGVAKRLKELLKKSGLKPPYILVGHSDGGLFVQMFARMYPKLTAGVVLVDSASENQPLDAPSLPKKTSDQYPEAIGFKLSQQQLKSAPAFPSVPLIVLTASYHGYKNPNKKFPILYKGKVVQMSGQQDQAIWEKLQNQLGKLSPRAVHVYAYGSSHYIQTHQPVLVKDAIYTAWKMGHQW